MNRTHDIRPSQGIYKLSTTHDHHINERVIVFVLGGARVNAESEDQAKHLASAPSLYLYFKERIERKLEAVIVKNKRLDYCAYCLCH